MPPASLQLPVVLATLLVLLSVPAAAQGDTDGIPTPESAAIDPNRALPDRPTRHAELPDSTEDPIVRGSLRTGIHDRENETDRDRDIESTLDLLFGDPGHTTVSGRLLARATGDVDGTPPGHDPSLTTLPDAEDTFGDDSRLVLYEAWLRLDDWPLSDFAVRLGRQEIVPFLGPTVDGGTLMWRPHDAWSFDLYGGLPWVPYEDRQPDDYLLGGMITWVPARGLRFQPGRWKWQTELTYYRDEHADGTYDRDIRWQTRAWFHSDPAQVKWNVTFLDGYYASHSLWIRSDNDSLGLTVTAGWDWQLIDSKGRVNEWSHFLPVMGEIHAHHLLTGGLGWTTDDDRFGVDLVASLRIIEDEEDVGPFNRDFFRLMGTSTIHRLAGIDGLTLSLSGSWVHAHDVNQGWHSFGELSFEAPRRGAHRTSLPLRVAVGSSYDMYKYDDFTGDERAYVRAVYGNVRLALLETLPIDVRVAYENADSVDYLRVDAFLTWIF